MDPLTWATTGTHARYFLYVTKDFAEVWMVFEEGQTSKDDTQSSTTLALVCRDSFKVLWE